MKQTAIILTVLLLLFGCGKENQSASKALDHNIEEAYGDIKTNVENVAESAIERTNGIAKDAQRTVEDLSE